ncbi:PREDICTED: sulfotransferase 4A1 [Colobus angolensis palliatus]|uniref:sulfotransferase 4A1 n=1 Tax=Colobus angolensis palliatus TaxID=336983 RepID=UPI0005F51C8B|nr:PREDICTED: sulfotransferase 4A1 [Colobus angolensis palliatus]
MTGRGAGVRPILVKESMLTERRLSRRREESGSEEAPGRGTNAGSLGKGWLGSEAGGSSGESQVAREWNMGRALGLPLSTPCWGFSPPGTSLLQEVVYLVSQGADPDEIGLMNIDEQLPVLEYPQPGLDIIKELTSPRLIKSHLPYRFLPSDLHNGDSKVSWHPLWELCDKIRMHHVAEILERGQPCGVGTAPCACFSCPAVWLTLSPVSAVGYGSWFEHVQEFWEHRMDSNVLFLKYEDVFQDLVMMVEQLARFLGVSCDKTQLEALTEHCHQLVDQCCNAEALPVGRGRVGLWKDIFTVSMNEKFDLVYKQKMGKCDLMFDFYL